MPRFAYDCLFGMALVALIWAVIVMLPELGVPMP